MPASLPARLHACVRPLVIWAGPLSWAWLWVTAGSWAVYPPRGRLLRAAASCSLPPVYRCACHLLPTRPPSHPPAHTEQGGAGG